MSAIATPASLAGTAPARAPDSGLRYDTRPELALVAVLQLMSRFPGRRSPALARAIVDQLRVIAADERFAAAVRECATRLEREWHALAVLCEPARGDAVRAAH